MRSSPPSACAVQPTGQSTGQDSPASPCSTSRTHPSSPSVSVPEIAADIALCPGCQLERARGDGAVASGRPVGETSSGVRSSLHPPATSSDTPARNMTAPRPPHRLQPRMGDGLTALSPMSRTSFARRALSDDHPDCVDSPCNHRTTPDAAPHIPLPDSRLHPSVTREPDSHARRRRRRRRNAKLIHDTPHALRVAALVVTTPGASTGRQVRALGVMTTTGSRGSTESASERAGLEQLTLVDIDDTSPSRRHSDPTPTTSPPPTELRSRHRPSSLSCQWCSKGFPVPARGRIPKWCSDSCRHRAWEQRRAAASGLCAVDVVERVVEVVRTQRVVEQLQVEIPAADRPRASADYAAILLELSLRLDTGRIYDRDLASLTSAMTTLIAAFNRRLH